MGTGTRAVSGLGLAVALGGTGLLGTAQAAEARLGLNSSLSLGCEVAAVRAGLQEGRFGGFVQGAYCTSNVEGRSGGPAFGGGLTFDVYQSPTLNAYLLAGANSNPVGNPGFYGGVGARYGLPLLPVEAYGEVGARYTQPVLAGLNLPSWSPKVALGVSYVWRGLDLSTLGGGESRPSNISAPGTGGLNVDQSGTPGAAAGGASSPASCNLSPDADAANAVAAARAAAEATLGQAASAYSAIYSNVSYTVSVGGANINGNTATVNGTINLRATNRANGEPVSGTYGGVVTLSRSGCGWTATGYRQNDE